MRCPICNREHFAEGNSSRPFCSERCKLIDLDNWLSERYRVSVPIESEPDAGTGSEPGKSEKADRTSWLGESGLDAEIDPEQGPSGKVDLD